MSKDARKTESDAVSLSQAPSLSEQCSCRVLQSFKRLAAAAAAAADNNNDDDDIDIVADPVHKLAEVIKQRSLFASTTKVISSATRP